MISTEESIGSGDGGTTTDLLDERRMAYDKPFARISWGAVFAGSLSALSAMLILSLIGVGIGLSTLDPGTADNPSGRAIGIGAVVWWLVSNLASLFLGGYVAGRLAGNLNGYLHGHVTWATVSIVMVMMLSSAMGRAFTGATGLAQFAATAPPTQTGQPNLQQQIANQAQDAVNRVQGAVQDATQNPNATAESREAADRAATGGAMGAFGAALALILGAGAAGIGGTTGKRRFLDRVPARKQMFATSRA